MGAQSAFELGDRARQRPRTRTVAAWVCVCAAMMLYVATTLIDHLSLRTNAFDLSVFDYALWNSLHGRFGWIPFMHHSIFSEHAMAVLLLLVPAYAVHQSPVSLILVQLTAVTVAAVLFVKLLNAEQVPAYAAAVLVGAFLLSRQSFRAISGVFYPECLQPLLVFSCVMAWRARRRWWYSASVAALLATKEDAALFVIGFAIMQFFTEKDRRREAAYTALYAFGWLLAATIILLPLSRHADGLSAANPLLEARYSSPAGVIRPGELLARLLSFHSVSVLTSVFGAFGLLSLAAPEWLIPIGLGLMLNLAANPASLQASISGHYLWSFLPWLAIAAMTGFKRLERKNERLAVVFCVLLAALTVDDSPMFRAADRFIVDKSAAMARSQLPETHGLSIAAQPNLLPHLPHSNMVATVGQNTRTTDEYDMVLLTPVGDTWPFTKNEVNALIAAYSLEPKYRQVISGPLFVFRRRDRRLSSPNESNR